MLHGQNRGGKKRQFHRNRGKFLNFAEIGVICIIGLWWMDAPDLSRCSCCLFWFTLHTQSA